MGKITGNGLVSGVCYDPDTKEIIVVYDKEREALNSHALPGGMVESGETPEQAMRREWSEEVGAAVKSFKLAISRSRKGGNYDHYFYRIELADSGTGLRNEGFPGETGPPERVSFRALILGEVKMHYSHLKGLCLSIKKEVLKMAKEDKEIAFALTELGITR